MTRSSARLLVSRALVALVALLAVLAIATPVVAAQVPEAPSAEPARPHDGHRHRDPGPEEFVPIVVPLASFGTLVFVVGLALYYRQRRDGARLETARYLVEKGLAIPAGLFEVTRPPTPANDLKRGFILLATGLGIGATGFFSAERSVIGLSFIPGFIGLAYVAVWRIQRGSAKPEVEA